MENKMIKLPELLAPAGSFEKAKIAFYMEQMPYMQEHLVFLYVQEQKWKIMI